MKNSLLLVALLCCLPVLAQQKFMFDTNGYVDNPSFKTLIKERRYELVSSYLPVDNDSTYYARIVKNGFWGFIDQAGNEVIKPQFLYVSRFQEGRSTAAIEQLNDTVFRYVAIDTRGNILGKPYDKISLFDEGFAEVKLNGKKGLIDKTGAEVIAPVYDAVQADGGSLFAYKNKRWGLLDANGKELTPFKYSLMGYSNGILYGENEASDYCILDPKTGKPYNDTWFNELNSRFHSFTVEQVHAVKTNGRGYLVDRYAKRVSQEFLDVERLTWDYYTAEGINGTGLIDKEGTVILECAYDYITTCNHTDRLRARKDGKYYYFDENAQPVPGLSAYGDISDFACNRVSVVIDGKIGFADYNGSLVIPAVYEKTRDGFFQGLTIAPEYKDVVNAVVKYNGKWGVIDKDGNVVVPFEYDFLDFYPRGYVAVKGSKTGFINKKGIITIPLQYDEIEHIDMREPPFFVKSGNKYGLIDCTTGREIAPVVYTSIYRGDYEPYYICFGTENTVGLFDYNGRVAAEIVGGYSITPGNGGLFHGSKDKRGFYADSYGNLLYVTAYHGIWNDN